MNGHDYCTLMKEFTEAETHVTEMREKYGADDPICKKAVYHMMVKWHLLKMTHNRHDFLEEVLAG